MIFMTGGTGLLGMRMVFDLLKDGEKLRLLKRSDSDMSLFREVLDFYHGSDSSHLIGQIEWVEGDILDPLLLEEAVRGCNCCIHAAAVVSFHPKDRDIMNHVNIQGTANVVNACNSEKNIRLLYISSVAALGRSEDSGSFNEESLWKDSPYNSAYAISKYHAEMEVWRGVEEGLDAVIVNPTIILGAGSETRSSGTIYGVVLSGLKFYTDGLASIVDARDVSTFSLALMRSEITSERFVLNANSLAYKDLFARVAKSLSLKEPAYYASPTVLGLAWRLAWLKDTLFGGRSSITRETVLSARSSYNYSTAKLLKHLNVDYRELDETIDYYASFYS